MLNDIRLIGMELVKQACLSSDTEGGEHWTHQFRDSPYYGQALALEAQNLKITAQLDAMEAERDAERRQQEAATGGDRWSIQRQFTIRKKALMSELLEWKAQQMSQQAAGPEEAAEPGMEEMAPGVPPVSPEEMAQAEQAAAAAAQMQEAAPAAPGPAGLGALAQPQG